MPHAPVARRGGRWLLLVVMYYLITAAAFHGYFAKWKLRDDTPQFALPSMLEGTGDRPFVYRQLLPAIANEVDHVMPEKLRARATDWLLADGRAHGPIAWFYPDATDARNPKYALRYYMIFYMSFAALFLAMFAMRAVCLVLKSGEVASTLAPMAIAVALPLVLTEGGYFYDFPELLFMALAVWMANKGRVLWLLSLTVVATLNKESFLFFTLTLYPFLRTRFSVRKTLTLQAIMLALAGAANVLIKLRYAHNGGGIIEYHLLDNFAFLIRPMSYLRFEYNYGVVTPKGFNVIFLAVAVWLLRSGWSRLPDAVRRHVWIALAINVPLFLLFGFHDELRNLSMLMMGVLMIVSVNISLWLDQRDAVSAAHEQAGTAAPGFSTTIGDRSGADWAVGTEQYQARGSKGTGR
ncbi:hypothetical protein [Caballeronia ptereochthonis]|uniref:Uncharacterized protein n=1 Tax=Caballeronia ptereochthonis TaxID=1777144 RepID=A0A158CBS4_9BURK|nr:hypothetical protein [Caballeronia ptereochthonis]SAK79759.1 hypothetical protein AWB83_04180 [Caballeronia ptereochthonis]